MPTKIYAGTSGFAYREWRGSFYPAGIHAEEMLPFYGARLPAVEINGTFYRMPTLRVMEEWRRGVPESFRFALKAPALITHRKRLDAGEETAAFLHAVAGLGPKLGPLLFQLPPFLSRDLPLLEAFLATVAGVRVAVEFRHPSWFEEATYRLLEQFGCALCISDREGLPDPPLIATAPFGYLRLRREKYDPALLERWRERVGVQGWKEAYLFFRHEETGEGTRLAARFLDPTLQG